MQIQHRDYDIHFPAEGSPVPWSPWEIAGMAAWLWAASALHRSWDMALFEREVIESVSLGQFVVMTHGGRPAGFLSWGHLSEEAEVRYIADPLALALHDKCSGRHLWMLNWVAPQGGTEAMFSVGRRHLFRHSVWHMLRVKPDNHAPARLVSGRGLNVSRTDYAHEVQRMHRSYQLAQQRRSAG